MAALAVQHISYSYGFNMFKFDGEQITHSDNTTPADVVREIRMYAKHLLDAYVLPFGYAAAEMASWTELLAEAKAYQASGDVADAPLCNAEAIASSLPIGMVIGRIVTNATAYQDYLTAVKGARNKHLIAISQLTGDDALNYDWRSGWPE